MSTNPLDLPVSVSPALRNNRRILVGIDFEDIGDRALRAAFSLAVSSGATEVHVVWVRVAIEGMPVSSRLVKKFDAELDRLRTHVQKVLDEWTNQNPDSGIPDISLHHVSGAPSSAIVRLAAALDAGLVVVGTHGRRGLSRAVLGSVAAEVLAKATCPVLVVRPVEHEAVDLAAPEIEPLCAECATQRHQTGDATAWCPRHAEHHGRGRLSFAGGTGSVTTRPWGFS